MDQSGTPLRVRKTQMEAQFDAAYGAAREFHRAVKAELDRGRPATEIAAVLGVSRSQVYKYAAKASREVGASVEDIRKAGRRALANAS